MKHKLLQGIIQDLMKVPLGDKKHGGKGTRIEIMEMGHPKAEGMEDMQMPHEMGEEDESPLDAKKVAMEKAIHAKKGF